MVAESLFEVPEEVQIGEGHRNKKAFFFFRGSCQVAVLEIHA